MTDESKKAEAKAKEKKTLTPEQKKEILAAKILAEEEKRKKALERKKNLERKLKDLENPGITRKQENHIKVLYGVAVLALMKSDQQLEAQIRNYLDQSTKREADRKLLGLPPKQ